MEGTKSFVVKKKNTIRLLQSQNRLLFITVFFSSFFSHLFCIFLALGWFLSFFLISNRNFFGWELYILRVRINIFSVSTFSFNMLAQVNGKHFFFFWFCSSQLFVALMFISFSCSFCKFKAEQFKEYKWNKRLELKRRKNVFTTFRKRIKFKKKKRISWQWLFD